MSAEISMPKLSDTMEEGTIIRWGVKVGDRVSKGDVIAEVETDKAAMEMEAFEEGVVAEIRVSEGETVPVGTVIAVLSAGAAESKKVMPEESVEKEVKEPEPSGGEPAEKPPEPPEKREKETTETEREKSGQPAEEEIYPEVHEDERVAVSPAARKLAEEKRISISELKGTGPGGRIVLADVEKKNSAKTTGVSERPVEKEKESSVAAAESKARRVRKVVARKMEESWKNIPHFYVTMAVDVGDALRFQKDLKVSLNDFILAAAGRSLRDHPRVNSMWQEGEAVSRDEVNVAFAVATEQGLYSPVVRNCNRLSLQEIHQRSHELQKKIKAGTIGGDELEGATFTVSNMGMLGVESFSAIITPPQAAALAVGEAVAEAVVMENGEMEVVKRLRLTLSADHRVMDGADGAAFLKSVKNYLEAPLQLIVNLE